MLELSIQHRILLPRQGLNIKARHFMFKRHKTNSLSILRTSAR